MGCGKHMHIFFLLILIYVAAMISGFVMNFVRMKKAKKYLNQYIIWLQTGKSDIDLMEHQELVKTLVERAGKGGRRVPVSQPVGFGQVANFNADPFSAFPNRIENVAHVTYQTLKSCIGIYRSRMWKSLNPLYWIGMIVLLPKHILSYLGVTGEKFIVKLMNLLWWAFSTVVTGVILKENAKPINDYIINLLK